jgi:predicted TIM-barrel fold metal-dependent hydrolase
MTTRRNFLAGAAATGIAFCSCAAPSAVYAQPTPPRVAHVGASQVVLSTDHPIPLEQHPVDHVFSTSTPSDKQNMAILGGNAARLFGLKEA